MLCIRGWSGCSQLLFKARCCSLLHQRATLWMQITVFYQHTGISENEYIKPLDSIHNIINIKLGFAQKIVTCCEKQLFHSVFVCTAFPFLFANTFLILCHSWTGTGHRSAVQQMLSNPKMSDKPYNKKGFVTT